ncbi:ABC transporter permease [Erysipelotrichaceae bacterium OH741_COT-311]|nr:ABC transporter permease [Erysipelotrichaceae bacterium]RRC91538.1 ABC transporter permease [Erysipelotrichaceae bacterium OH741_COT-311]
MSDNKFTFVQLEESASEHIASPQYSYWKSVFRKFFSSKLAIFMLIVAFSVLLIAFIQPIFSKYNPTIMPHINDRTMKYIRPNATYWFGTDDVGNSLFDAVWAGTKNSLIISLIATAITTVLGVIVGMFWGYSKKMDQIMIQIYNVFANIPFTLLVMVLMYTFGQGMAQLIFALSVTSWLGTAYFIRVQVMIIRDREYNLASRCLGTPTHRILKQNVLPYLVSVIVTAISRDVPLFISYEVFLSFIGVGLSQKEASLGGMIQKYSVYLQSASYLFWIPVCISAFISVSFYIVGQTLADASDPRTHMV